MLWCAKSGQAHKVLCQNAIQLPYHTHTRPDWPAGVASVEKLIFFLRNEPSLFQYC